MYYNVKYKHDISVCKKQIAKQIIEKEILRKQLVEAKEERYIEERARTTLGLVKKGEVAYQLIGNKNDRR